MATPYSPTITSVHIIIGIKTKLLTIKILFERLVYSKWLSEYWSFGPQLFDNKVLF